MCSSDLFYNAAGLANFYRGDCAAVLRDALLKHALTTSPCPPGKEATAHLRSMQRKIHVRPPPPGPPPVPSSCSNTSPMEASCVIPSSPIRSNGSNTTPSALPGCARSTRPTSWTNRTRAATFLVTQGVPDGYTLAHHHLSVLRHPFLTKQPSWDPVNDFTYIMQFSGFTFGTVVRADSPYQRLADVFAEARRKPGSVSYASAGAGTSNHLAGELLSISTGLKLVHVPYKGSAPALADVLGGHVPLMFDLITTSAANVRAGKLKALAVTGLKRSPLLADTPTASESGVPGFEISAWFAVFAPSKVPAPVLTRLSDEMREVLRAPDMVQSLRDLGGEPDTRSPAEFAAYVKAEVGKYASLIKNAGLAP